MAKPLPLPFIVTRVEDLTPVMRRVVFGGPSFEPFTERLSGYTDAYAKLVFGTEGVEYPEPFDIATIRETMPQDVWPVMRTYTIRHVDYHRQELWIDFVVHGDEGIAGPWAANAEPGDVLHIRGPSGGYAPKPEVDVHLFVGDESALPAIAASLEALPETAKAVAFIEVADEREEQEMLTQAELELTWLHRDGQRAGSTSLLADAVYAWPWPAGRVGAFVHGESMLLKTVRPYLLKDRDLPRTDVSVSGYWRRGNTEEGFRTWKSQQDEAVMRPAGS